MRSWWTACLLIFFSFKLFGQSDFFNGVIVPDSNGVVRDDSAYHYALGIQAENIRTHLEFLASDTCEGRELGGKGIERAARYIDSAYHSWGIPPLASTGNYFQEVNLTWIYWDKLSFKINGVPYKQLWDYLALPDQNANLEFQTNDFLFLGYGIDDPAYSDYAGLDLRGKVILIYKGEPKNKNGKYFISGDTSASAWSADLELKREAAKRHGVRMILVIEDQFKEFVDLNRSSVISPTVKLSKDSADYTATTNIMHLSSTTVTMLLGSSLKKVIQIRDKINRNGKPASLLIHNRLEWVQKRNIRRENGKNILAYIEGGERKDELVVLTAHYDHLGKRGNEVFNGADDNGSGSSSMMEIARRLNELKQNGIRPKRSILCMLVTGEEKGLLGSMYYVHHPVFPLEKTMANINIDMIGRTDDKYGKDSNYVYVIGSDRISPALHETNVAVNGMYSRLKLDHSYNSESDPNRYYYRSDHYNFAERGIPAIFFFSGVHEDYHRITDDTHKIRFGKTAMIARHVFLLAWNLANREEPLR